jgi:hypothetical protein
VNEEDKSTSTWCHLIAAPTIMGSALSWNARRRPIPSATEPLNRHPIKAPPKQMLTTSPAPSRDTACE